LYTYLLIKRKKTHYTLHAFAQTIHFSSQYSYANKDTQYTLTEDMVMSMDC